MPLLHISMRAGKPEAYRKAILGGLYRAMREALNVPEGDEFMTISEHSPANFRCGNAYSVTRSDDAVLIQITVFASRTPEQKKALYGGSRTCSAKTRASAPRTCSSTSSMRPRRTGPLEMASRNSPEAAASPIRNAGLHDPVELRLREHA